MSKLSNFCTNADYLKQKPLKIMITRSKVQKCSLKFDDVPRKRHLTFSVCKGDPWMTSKDVSRSKLVKKNKF